MPWGTHNGEPTPVLSCQNPPADRQGGTYRLQRGLETPLGDIGGGRFNLMGSSSAGCLECLKHLRAVNKQNLTFMGGFKVQPDHFRVGGVFKPVPHELQTLG